jgi:short-subunit dehydrogenase
MSQEHMMTSKRPVALVTGASSGIGKTASLALVQAGFEVIGTSRNTKHIAPLKGVTFLDLDVASDESVTAAVERVIQRFGRIDVLVNNAGIGSAGAAEENSVTQARDVFDINVFGVIRMTNAVLPHMRAQGSGRIINISSIVGFMPQPYMAVYAASKHAIEGYSESVDHEVRQYGVRVLLVEPAWTSTAFDANSVRPALPLQVYATQRHVFEQYMAAAVKDGDDPALVAKQIVAAATDAKPKLRYTVGQTGRVSTMCRLVPSRMFDRQLRKLNGLPA